MKFETLQKCMCHSRLHSKGILETSMLMQMVKLKSNHSDVGCVFHKTN